MATKQEERLIEYKSASGASGTYNEVKRLAFAASTGASGTVNELLLIALRTHFGVATGTLAELQARYAGQNGFARWSDVGSVVSGLFAPDTPTVYDWSVDFTTSSLNAGMTLTGGAGWYFNSSGVLAQSAANAARYHYIGGAHRGILLENGYTNYIDESDDLANAAFTANKCTTAKNATGVDGVLNSAITLTGDAFVSGVHKSYIHQSLTADEMGALDTPVIGFATVKKGTETFAALRARAEGTNVAEVTYNLDTVTSNVVATGTVHLDSGIIALPNSWFLIWCAINGRQSSTSTTLQLGVGIAPSATTLDWASAGSAGKTIVISRLDFMKNSYPVLGVVNATTPVARTADTLSASVTPGSVPLSANQRDITITVTIPRKPYGSDFKYLFRNGNESIQMNDVELRWYIDTTNYLSAAISWAANSQHTITTRKRSAGVSSLVIDGTEVSSNSAAAYLAAITQGANWFLGSDGTGNHADCVYASIASVDQS